MNGRMMMMMACLAGGCHGMKGLEGAKMEGPAVAEVAVPTNRWVLRHEQAPNIVWENGVAWDPVARRIVWHGGHVGRLYPQSNYTFLFEPSENRFTESQAPVRPQRRCLIHVAYAEGAGRTITSDGGSSHGSIPAGGLGGDYSRVHRSDARGPWLYDSARDEWEDCRTLPPAWRRKAHAAVAYEPGTDALFGLRESELVIYSVRLNRVSMRPLPAALHKRLGYGLAADPVRRKLVLFGGSAGGGYQWVQPAEGESVPDARRAAYERMVKRDTWVYDIAADRWEECAPKMSPPRGLPMNDMLNLQMVWHDASGTILLMQNGVDGYVTDNTRWTPAALWSFDTVSREWTAIPRTDDNPQPAFMGLLAYARELDQLFLFGGGRDGVGEEGSRAARPALSRQVWSCRVRVPGGTVRRAVESPRLTLTAGLDGVALAWNRPPGGGAWAIQRAECSPLPGEYRVLAGAPDDGRYEDRAIEAGKSYSYRLAGANGDWLSLPAFTAPPRPAGVLASVESAREVRLRWNACRDSNVAGYRVYRARGAELDKGEGRLLTPEPLKAERFIDQGVDLADGVIHSYWVKCVNAVGEESGASPLAYTAPDAPGGLTVPEGVGPSNGEGVRLNYVVSWRWPDDLRLAGFNVYGATDVPNGSAPELLKKTWQLLTPEPVRDREFVYSDPADGVPCRYFHVRAVNVLGQEGFSTDIVSPTDRRFRP